MKYSGRTTLHCHKFEDWKEKEIPKNPSPGISKVWFLDAQWSTCPIEVEEQVKDLWRWNELGNDNYIIKTSIEELVNLQEENQLVETWIQEKGEWGKKSLKTDWIVKYLTEQGIPMKDTVIIHWWW